MLVIMSYPKIISFLFISFIGIYVQSVKAQSLNINGDTIFVNMEAEIQLKFPTPPKNFNTVPDNTQYRIWDTGNGINLIAGSEDYTPATLSVSEAGRNHRFILIFKKEINNNEAKLYYDYSTEKKLAKHIRETAFQRSPESEKVVAKNEPVKDDKKKNKNEIAVEKPVDSSLNYYALLEQGDKDLKQQNYQDAILSFNKAHTLRPDDKIPLERLEEIKTKLSEKEKSTQEENDKKYLAITTEAKNDLDQKKYAEAQEAYKRALVVKPGDTFATQQLQVLSNFLTKTNAQKEKQKNKDTIKTNIAQAERELAIKKLTEENNYDTAVKSADNFFKAGDYDNAKIGYNKALGFIKKDYPKNQINKINKILNDQVAQANADKQKLAQQTKIASELKLKNDSILTAAEIRKRYNLTIALGRSSYIKNDLLNAKTFYEEAMNLQPSQQEPKNQLKIINKKLEVAARDSEINNNYERSITLADSQVIAKAYESAIANYKQASIIKPLESYPRKQLKYVQSEIVLNEKKKKEEEERRFSDVLTRADKAVTDKKYDDAKSAYTEALTIHPNNEYAKRRLEIISYQLEKENAEKLSQDTIKVAVPVKKSKRKKSF